MRPLRHPMGIERTALPPRTGCVDPSQAAGLAPLRGPHHCGTAPDSDRTSLNLGHPGTGPEQPNRSAPPPGTARPTTPQVTGAARTVLPLRRDGPAPRGYGARRPGGRLGMRAQHRKHGYRTHADGWSTLGRTRRRWMGSVPWRLAMGSLAMVVMLVGLRRGSVRARRERGPAPATRSVAETRGGHGSGRRHRRPADGHHSRRRTGPARSSTCRSRWPTARSCAPTCTSRRRPGTTTAANGLFPVLLQQTPYGKGFIVYASAIANTNVDYLVDRGYIVVIADVRGTGDSGGSFDLFDPVQSTDGVTLAHWAAHLPDPTARSGCSASPTWASTSSRRWAAGGAARRSRPCSPIISGNDLYADTVTQGGIPDAEFASTYVALLSGLNLTNPALQPLVAAVRSGNPLLLAAGLANLAPTVAAHSPALVSFLRLVLAVETGTGRRRIRRRLLGGAQPGARPACSRRRQDPCLPRRRLERPLRVGRAAELRRAAESLRRPLAVRRHDAGPAGHRPLPAADGPLAARDDGQRASTCRRSSSSGSTPGCWGADTDGHDGDAAAPQHPQCRRHLGRRRAVAAARRHADRVLLRAPGASGSDASPPTTATCRCSRRRRGERRRTR